MEAMAAVSKAIAGACRVDVFTIDMVLRDLEESIKHYRRGPPPEYLLTESQQLLDAMLSRGDCWALTATLGASDGR